MTEPEPLRRAFAAAGENSPDTGACPGAAGIFDAAAGGAPTARFESLLEHTIGCGACAESWRLARELAAEAGAAAPARARAILRSPFFLALAATLVVAAALAMLRLGPASRGTVTWRSEPRPSIESLSPEGDPLPREAFVLRWTAPAEGARYAVTVGRETLEPLYSRENLDRPELLVPASALEPLPAGAKVLWRVQARLPDGRILTSPTFITPLP